MESELEPGKVKFCHVLVTFCTLTLHPCSTTERFCTTFDRASLNLVPQSQAGLRSFDRHSELGTATSRKVERDPINIAAAGDCLY